MAEDGSAGGRDGDSCPYMNAARTGKNALTICTISDSLVTGEVTTSEERQTSFADMMKVALEIA